MTLAMVVRSDRGGLGNQTFALWEKLQPDHTIIVELPDPRGANDTRKYTGASVDGAIVVSHAQIPWTSGALTEALRDSTHLLTVEGLYTDAAGWRHVNDHCHTVLVANPELYEGYPADSIVVPTLWELERMPRRTDVLPHPVPYPPLSHQRERDVVRTFLHHVAPAFHDRNGTEVLLHALPLVSEECRLIVRAPGVQSPYGEDIARVGKVVVSWDSRSVDSLWDNYPEDADAMVMPRRYGGLCLPVMEAAACGIPSIMTDLSPQRLWPTWRVPVRQSYPVQMKGGTFDVWSPSPEDVTWQMNELLHGNCDVGWMSHEVMDWSMSLTWEAVGDRWRKLCGLT